MSDFDDPSPLDVLYVSSCNEVMNQNIRVRTIIMGSVGQREKCARYKHDSQGSLLFFMCAAQTYRPAGASTLRRSP